MIAFALAASGAHAVDCPSGNGWDYIRDECTCHCSSAVYRFPPTETVVPTNVLLRIDGINNYRLLRNGELIPSDGESVPNDHVLDTTLFIRPDVPLEPGDQLELWTAGVPNEILVGSWTVGNGPDLTPPGWTGKYKVETISTHTDECGEPEHSHYITFEGVYDDSLGGRVMAIARGAEEFAGDKIGDETGFDVRWDKCSHSTDLYGNFHRKYEVTLVDAAGNRSGPFKVRTGRNTFGCGPDGPTDEEYEDVVGQDDLFVDRGCSVAPGATPYLAPLALLVRRRRRPPGR